MSLPEVLVRLLQKYHVSQRKVAERSGVNYVTLNRIINGYDFQVTRATIEKIANGIGCTREETDELLRAAGRVPQTIEHKFGESESTARVFRRISEMDADKIEQVEKLLDELEGRK